MFEKLMPREGRFFDLFCESADQIVLGAHELKAMMIDLDHLESRSCNIKRIEAKADEITHRTVKLLHETFITPIDRDDIHKLITKMDDVIDTIEDVSQSMFLYDVTSIPDTIIQLVNICVSSVEHVKAAVSQLSNLKNPTAILRSCVEINRLENEADHLMRSAMAKLFREETDARQLFKIKAIYEFLEQITDDCEDVANIIEGIVLEYA